VTEELERLGLVILKDEQGKYVARGTRNIKINGENIKPILARAAGSQECVTVLNHVNITDLIVEDQVVQGAYGFHVDQPVFYEIRAKAVLIATGGAAGLYRPNNPGFSRHKMWYPPFNTGAGYAMGLLAGAEMTTFEMRFIALRCKDTIAPTGTIAQGVGARQINASGEVYEQKYGLATSERVYGTVMENREGRGPCYLKTDGITQEQEEQLYRAYLNMAPSQTLRWLESGKGPAVENVEIEGTEPYIVGGHTASGYWIDDRRATTIRGLYAAGDVAGGAPQKYVTGALAEGEIAAESILTYLKEMEDHTVQYTKLQSSEKSESGRNPDTRIQKENDRVDKAPEKLREYTAYLNRRPSLLTAEQMEETMQKIMDQYAGGIGSDYRYSEASLAIADEKIRQLQEDMHLLSAADMDELLQIYELRERLIVCRAVIAHLKARKETRWHSFAEHTDYPGTDDRYLKYVNSRMEDGRIQIILRELVTGGDGYEHQD
jgi:adenylylsulfate reductase subunit A